MNIPLKGDLFEPLKEQRPAMARRRGHAAWPGTGPAGETCKSCSHYYLKSMGKDYRKCALMRSVWTGGAATDIRANDPACSEWEELQKKASVAPKGTLKKRRKELEKFTTELLRQEMGK